MLPNRGVSWQILPKTGCVVLSLSVLCLLYTALSCLFYDLSPCSDVQVSFSIQAEPFFKSKPAALATATSTIDLTAVLNVLHEHT